MLFDHELAWTDEKIYEEIYENSINRSEAFWAYHAQSMDFIQKPRSIFEKGEWFRGAVANVSYNCVDRHAKKNPDKTAIVWYGDEESVRMEVSYGELLKKVIQIASLLRKNGIKKGDIVGIYMPMHPDSIAAMLACARVGAVHLVTFAGFSPSALAYRLNMSKAKVLLSFSKMHRGGKEINLRENCFCAIEQMEKQPRLFFLDDQKVFDGVEISEEIEQCNSSDNLFVLYTSGSTGKPKGITHSTIPYMIYAATTFKTIFNIKQEDVYFCSSDIGWITGHSYIAYAPLFHGLTVVLFEGTPIYPTADRYWEIIENEKVNIFYTAPTAIRSLKALGDEFVLKHDLSSLRVLGSVGEPIDEEAWKWYFEVVGKKRCPIVDTWWQTETGGIILAPLLDITKQKPCVAGKPFFGIAPRILTPEYEIVESQNKVAKLMIEGRWPGMCKSVLYECEYSKKMERNGRSCEDIFKDQYFSNGRFNTGDGAVYDKDFDIKVVGRLDDVLNISGHRLSTAEFEDAIHKVDSIGECAVVAIPHKITGQAAFVFAVKNNSESNDETTKKIIKALRTDIGAIAKPEGIAFVSDLPKTRSGKIVRHLLRDIAQNKVNSFQSLSSLANREILREIVRSVKMACAA